MSEDRPLRAFTFMLCAQLCFSLNILMLRLCERAERLARDPHYHLPHWEAMVARSLLLLSWCLLILNRTKPRALERREEFWLWARGIAGVLSLSAYYYGVLHIPLGMASLFSNSSPLYVTLLALLFSGETLNRWGIYALIGGFIGVSLVVLGGFHGLSHVPGTALLIAGLSGPLSATAYFSIRQLKQVSTAQVMLSLGLGGSILSLLVIAFKGPQFPQSPSALSWLFLSALPAIAAQECLTRSFRNGPAAQVAPLQYTGPLFSTLLASLFLEESLPLLAIVGIICVLVCGCAIPLWQAKKQPS